MKNYREEKRSIDILLVSIILVLILIAVAGYFALNNRSTMITPITPPTDKEQPSSPSPKQASWQFIDADSFSLSVPPGWKFTKLEGTDSYIGEFVGDGIKLSFDFGQYSNSLAEDNNPNHIVTYETIDGYTAKIVVPKVTGNGITGIYFGNLGQNRFNLYGNNLTASQQQTALKIFQTIKIKS